MKKFVILVAVTQSLLLVGCSGNRLPNSAVPGTVGDPYGTGAGYGTGTGVSDPYGTGAGYGTGTGYSDPYGTGAGYGAGTGYSDPYGTGAGYGTGTGMVNDPYGTGAGYGTGVGTGYGTGVGYGQPGMGQGYVDPVTGQPLVDTGVSQSIMTQLQQAGGISSSKADNIVRDALKSTSVQSALGAAPLEHRSMFIKALLDGWASDDDRTVARQIWNTILPQDQQLLLQQDAELSKLVTNKLLEGGSNGISGIAKELGKFIGLG